MIAPSGVIDPRRGLVAVMMDIYRDPLAAIRSRIEELDSQVAALRSRFTDQLWSQLPEETARRLRELEQAASARSDDRAGLHRATAVLEAYRRALEEAVELATRIERELAHLPSAAPELEPPPLRGMVGISERADEIVREIWRRLKPVDPHCSVHVVRAHLLTPTHFKARFQTEGCPFSLLLVPLSETIMETTLATSVSSLAPRLQVFPRSVLHTLLRAVGLLHAVEVGDLAFERRFTVEAGAAVARQVLSPQLRQLLLQLSQAARVTLVVRDGMATCCWTRPLDLPTLRGAARLLAAIRLAPTRAGLLRGRP